ASASASAIARPMPVAPPVTHAPRPARYRSLIHRSPAGVGRRSSLRPHAVVGVSEGPGPSVPRDSRALRESHHPVVEILVEDDLPLGKAPAARLEHESPHPPPLERDPSTE